MTSPDYLRIPSCFAFIPSVGKPNLDCPGYKAAAVRSGSSPSWAMDKTSTRQATDFVWCFNKMGLANLESLGELPPFRGSRRLQTGRGNLGYESIMSPRRADIDLDCM